MTALVFERRRSDARISIGRDDGLHASQSIDGYPPDRAIMTALQVTNAEYRAIAGRQGMQQI